MGKRKHVSRACDFCRESKVKCDAARPSCSNCQHRMRPCNYQVGTDRRKISLKFVVDLLVHRVGELSQVIIDHGITVPPMVDENDAALKDTLEALGLREIKMALEGGDVRGQVGYGKSMANIDENAIENIDADGLESDMNLLMEPFMILEGQHPYQAHSETSFPLPPPDVDGFSMRNNHGVTDSLAANPSSSSGNEIDDQVNNQAQATEKRSEDHSPINGVQKTPDAGVDAPAPADSQENDGLEDIVHRLSDRMGSLQIGSDGQVRYYGPTSGFNLLRMPTPDKLTIHRTVRKDGRDYLNRMGLDQEVPPGLEEHLTNLFFTWHSPSVDVVDRNMYEKAKQQWQEHMEDTPYHSEALTSAMCCLGAAFEPRYHHTFITYPRSLSDFFADRAKTLLEIELDSPTVATVQAMIVLSFHDIGCRRDSRGWLYSGMAMRLAFDLGLHLDTSQFVSSGSINQNEAHLRSMVFWGAYTLDHHWGFLLGRPFRISLEDVTVQKPGLLSEANEAQRWCPYWLPYPTLFPAGLSIPHTASQLSLQRVTLAEIMTPLGHILYGSSKLSKEALQAHNVETTDKLLQWRANLPEVLNLNIDECNSPVLPHVLLLHMYYHQAMIHAHRPWMSKNSIQPQPQRGPGHYHARRTCIESATAISKLLHIYEKYYTFSRINVQAVAITCSAALMLIFAKAICHNSADDQATLSNLNVCFRALDEFGASWESAKRAQNFLLHMQGLWETRIRAYRIGKRVASQSQETPYSDSPGSKRSRTSLPSVRPDPRQVLENTGSNTESESEVLDWLWAETVGSMPS